MDELVLYSSKDTHCYICKEKLEVVMDEEDETWYFTAAKKVKIYTVKDGVKEKKVVIVHTDCLKQIEMNRM